IEEKAKTDVKTAKDNAGKVYLQPIKQEAGEAIELINAVTGNNEALAQLSKELASTKDPIRKDVTNALRKTLRITRNEPSEAREQILAYLKDYDSKNVD